MRALILLLAVVGLIVGAGVALMRSSAPASIPGAAPLEVYVAAGLRPAMEAAVAAFTAAEGIPVHLTYGGSGDLESRLRVVSRGDLYLPADNTYAQRLQGLGLVREILPLARQRPVLAVAAGNPHGVTGLADLLARTQLRMAAPNPESASLGRLLRDRLTGDLAWPRIAARLTVTKPTVTEVAADLATGAVDAALLWDAQLVQFPSLVAVPEAALSPLVETVPAGVLAASTQPAAALRFARFLAGPSTGNPIFAKHGYEPVPGDAYTARPTVVLFAGAVNKTAVGDLLTTFAEREGIEIRTTYNGCGVLCASMQAIQSGGAGSYPDGYYACDICFVEPVADQFPEAVMLTETEILIAVPAGNPAGIHGLLDLARPGLRLGICNAQQSTLGYITAQMLKTSGLTAKVMANAVSQVPTGDLLVNQLLTGSLDAAIVYATNVHQRTDRIATVAIRNVPAKAIQPFAVWKGTAHPALMARLLVHLQAHPDAFREAGFIWHTDQRPTPSAELPIPDYLRRVREP
jgi:molybdate transport system substrate-binding protein